VHSGWATLKLTTFIFDVKAHDFSCENCIPATLPSKEYNMESNPVLDYFPRAKADAVYDF
jgi:hypothetical protein